MESRGFDVLDAGSVSGEIVRKEAPAYAILDMKLEDGSGLNLVQDLNKKRPDCKIVMLTGFGNIATAVAAVKAGAMDYLPKPADPDAIAAALCNRVMVPPPPQDPMSADRVRWSTSSASTSSAGRMSRKLRAVCACIGVRCSEFSANTLRATDVFHGVGVLLYPADNVSIPDRL